MVRSVVPANHYTQPRITVFHRPVNGVTDFRGRPQTPGVYRRIDPSPGLLSLAALQGGVLTADQTAGHGLTRSAVDRLIGEGRWNRITKGVYFASERTPDWQALAWSGVLLGGVTARLGGAAAGHLHGLNDSPDVIEVMVPMTTVMGARASWRFVRERPEVRSPRSVGSPPRLSVEDTVLDLCERATEGQVVDLVTRAVQNRRTTPRRLQDRMANRSRLRHRRLLEQLLADVAEGAETPLELKYVRDVERPHSLPRSNRQLPPRRGKGYRDVTYEEFALIVELDGRLGHEGTGRFRDMRRDNAAILMGQLTLRYGWWDVVQRPCLVALEVAAVLTNLGWTGVATSCDHCPNAADVPIV